MDTRRSITAFTAIATMWLATACTSTHSTPGPTMTSSSTQTTPAPVVTPPGASSFYAHRDDQAADTFTAPNGSAYQVGPNSAITRRQSTVSLDMPSVGSMLGQGFQTVDHDYSIATVHSTAQTASATLTLRNGHTTRTIKALRGVVTVGSGYFAVFAVKPGFQPSDIVTITRSSASGSVTLKP